MATNPNRKPPGLLGRPPQSSRIRTPDELRAYTATIAVRQEMYRLNSLLAKGERNFHVPPALRDSIQIWLADGRWESKPVVGSETGLKVWEASYKPEFTVELIDGIVHILEKF